jgi:integrase
LSVQVRHNGKHLVRFTDERGRSKAKTFEANEKRKAQDFDAECKRRRRHGEVVAPSQKTLSELRVDWLGSRRGRDLAPRTIEFYDGIWTKHIEPELGKTSINRIDALMIDDVVVGWEKRGVGHATIVKALTQLSAMFRLAVKHHMVQTNPMTYVDRPKPKQSRIVRPLTPIQVEGIRARMEPRDALLVSILAYAGLRPGEVLSLRWSDFQEDRLHVDSAISLGEEGPTKTKKARDVKLLAPLKAELLEYRMSIGRPSDTELIFSTHDGGFWASSDWRNFRQRAFADAVEAIGLPKETRPYDLRHSAASLSIASGADVVRVAKQMGHSPTMLLERYSHVFEEFEDKDVDPDALIVDARKSLSAEEAIG